MKIADYGKAITSYIESPTTVQKLKAKESANLLTKRLEFDSGGTPLQRLKQEIVDSMKPYAPSDVTEDQLQLVVKDITLDMTAEEAQASALSNFRKLFGMADGGRVHLAEGSEDIVEPSKSMQVDTTTKGLDLFTIDDFKEKAEIYVGAYHNNALPTADIKSALNKFTQKGIDDGTFSADDAIKIVQDLKFQFQDRAQKQRLRDVIIEGTGTVDRKDFYKGALVTEGPNKGKYMVKFPYKQDYGNSKFKGVQYGTKEEIEKLIADRKIAADASYKAGVDKAAKIAKEKAEADIKKTIDSFIKEGDYENFKTKPYESQLKRVLPSGNIRQSVGGRVNPKTFQYISDMLASGDFENLSRITGRSIEELMEFSNKIPKKGVIDIEQRAKSAKESFPEERKLTEEQKQLAEKKVQSKRKDRLVKTTNLAKFISGSDDFPFHHIKQIGGEVPLKRSDLIVIDKVMNSTLSPYNKKLNDIADAISQKITESFQAMNAKNESRALKLLKEVDVLNNQAEQIVKKAQETLPDKFKPLIGFNKFTARTDEYGFPLDDKVLVEPVGGGVKKGVIEKDLTKYTRKEVKELQKEINKQVKILELQRDIPTLTTADKINRPEKSLFSDKFKTAFTKGLKTTGKVIKPVGYAFGANAVRTAISKAEDQGLELNLMDKIIAFDSGDAEVALNNAKRRVDPEFAAAERAKDLAKITDDFEEVGQTTFGKYNDQIKTIKLP